MNRRILSALGAAALVLGAGSGQADVPFAKVYLQRAVEVQNQEAFPDWIVLVFPGAPPSGRPAAWPTLVEPEFHAEVDRKVLGTPKLWILKRSALPDLEAAARDNDDQLEGPVAKLLAEQGEPCVTLEFEDAANLPQPTIADTQLLVYKLAAASEAGCKMKSVTATYLQRDEIKRGPMWARLGPKRRPSSAAPAQAEPPASGAPVDSTADAPAAGASAAPGASPSAATSAASVKEPPVPMEGSKGSGCGCRIGDGLGSEGWTLALLLLFGVARWRP